MSIVARLHLSLFGMLVEGAHCSKAIMCVWKNIAILSKIAIYVWQYIVDDKNWYRLNLGSCLSWSYCNFLLLTSPYIYRVLTSLTSISFRVLTITSGPTELILFILKKKLGKLLSKSWLDFNGTKHAELLFFVRHVFEIFLPIICKLAAIICKLAAIIFSIHILHLKKRFWTIWRPQQLNRFSKSMSVQTPQIV